MKEHGWTRAMVLLFAVGIAPALFGCPEDPAAEISKVLAAQQAAWNARDIEGFMGYYWKSDSLTFQSGAMRYRGWQTMLDRYKKNYAGGNWGALTFSDLEVHLLAADAAYVLGRWSVESEGKPGQGVFTIILRRFPEGWRIIHDHTS